MAALLATHAATAADITVKIQGPPGLTVFFQVTGGTKANQTSLFTSKGDGVTDVDGDGWYVETMPDKIASKIRLLCAWQHMPAFEATHACFEPKWQKIPAPKDGVYVLNPMK